MTLKGVYFLHDKAINHSFTRIFSTFHDLLMLPREKAKEISYRFKKGTRAAVVEGSKPLGEFFAENHGYNPEDTKWIRGSIVVMHLTAMAVPVFSVFSSVWKYDRATYIAAYIALAITYRFAKQYEINRQQTRYSLGVAVLAAPYIVLIVIGHLAYTIPAAVFGWPLAQLPSESADSLKRYVIGRHSRGIRSADEVGKKGENLLLMKQLALPVPDFVIVSTKLFREKGLDFDFTTLANDLASEFQTGLGAEYELVVRPAGIVNMPGILDTIKGIKSQQELSDALKTVYSSWDNSSAREYRKANGISEESGLAVIVQVQVYGDRGTASASGAFYIRNPNSGEDTLFGSYYINARGEKTMSGSVDPNYRRVQESMQKDFPAVYQQLLKDKEKLERHYQYPQEVEFVIQEGKLYYTQTVDADLPADIASRIVDDMYRQGIVSARKVTVSLTDPAKIEVPVYVIRQDAQVRLIAQGEALSRGAVDGFLAFSLERAAKIRAQGKKSILVAPQRTDEMLQALVERQVDSLITFYGNFNMHDARIARESFIPAISLLQNREIRSGNLVIGDVSINEGGRVVLDGHKGRLLISEENNILDVSDKATITGLSVNVNQIKAQVRNRYQILSYSQLAILHAVMAANITLSERYGSHDQDMLALDIATNAMHEMAIEKGVGAGKTFGQVETELVQMTKGYYDVQYPDWRRIGDTLRLRSPTDLFNKSDSILAGTLNRYLAMRISAIDYPNYSLDHENTVQTGDMRVPVEFSIILHAPTADFRRENMAMIQQLWEPELLVRYSSDPEHRAWSGAGPHDWVTPDLRAEALIFAVDPLDFHKIRVRAILPFPKSPYESLNQVAFTLQLGCRTARFPGEWLKVRDKGYIILNFVAPQVEHRVEEMARRITFQPPRPDTPHLSDDQVRQLLRGQLVEEATRVKSKDTAPSEFYDWDFSISPFKPQNVFDQSKGVYPWRFDTASHGGYISPRISGMSDHEGTPDLRPFHLNEAYAYMLHAIFPTGSIIASLKYQDVFDGLMDHLYGWMSCWCSTWITLSEEIISKLAAATIHLQNEIDIHPILKMDSKDQVIGIDIESLVIFLYQSSQRRSTKNQDTPRLVQEAA